MEFDYYRDVNDSDFYEDIFKRKEFYENQQIKTKETIEKLCDVKEFKLLPSQKLLANFMIPEGPHKVLLVFHGTGVGKTCTAVRISDNFVPQILMERSLGKKSSIYVLTTGASEPNFISALLSKCVENRYLSDDEYAYLEKLRSTNTILYKKYIDFLKGRFTGYGKIYKFMGYGEFRNKFSEVNEFGVPVKRIDDSVLIIDEAHNLINMESLNDYAEVVRRVLHHSKNVVVVYLTATPIKHKAEELIDLMNLIVYWRPEKYLRQDFFEMNKSIGSHGFKESLLTIKGEKEIREILKGKISYLRGNNPATYPKEIEMGEIIPTPSGEIPIKYTKLIKCEMSKEHYKTYKERGRNVIDIGENNIVNMVFPSPSGENVFMNQDISQLQYAPKEFLKKHGIDFVVSRTPERKKQLTGPILEMNNLRKYSSKFAKILENLIYLPGHAFLFNSFVQGTGSSLWVEILKNNGFLEYYSGLVTEGSTIPEKKYDEIRCAVCGDFGSSHKKYNPKKSGAHMFYPAVFGVIEGGHTAQTREMINVFNSQMNKNTELIKIVVTSLVGAESIDFKRLKRIHIVNFMKDLQLLKQIVGRGARHCSHADLPEEERVVETYKYVSSVPGKIYIRSIEENKYAELEFSHIAIKKVERMMKEIAFDCSLNKAGNQFTNEIKEYADCVSGEHLPGKKVPKGTLCSSLCDYQRCDYNCEWEPNVKLQKNMLSKKSMKTETAEAYFWKNEFETLISMIEKKISENSFLNVNEFMKNDCTECPNYTEDVINFAINFLISNEKQMKNSFGENGILSKIKTKTDEIIIHVPSNSLHPTNILDLMPMQKKHELINLDITEFIDGLVISNKKNKNKEMTGGDNLGHSKSELESAISALISGNADELQKKIVQNNSNLLVFSKPDQKLIGHTLNANENYFWHFNISTNEWNLLSLQFV